MKTVLISGSGSGMGLLTAQTLMRQGYVVYAGVRDPYGRNAARRETLEDYAAKHNAKVHVVDMDIHSESSCQNAVNQVIADHGRIDITIHNAAHLFIGMAEGFTPEQMASSINTNVVGAHRLNRAVLPHMRRQGDGILLYVGSAATRTVMPFVMPYITGKAALDALAETTAYEINHFGIETVIVMPGLFVDGTEHFASAIPSIDESVVSQYGSLQSDFDSYGSNMLNLFRDRNNVPVQGVADEIARVLALPKGAKPLRTMVDYSDYGAEAVNGVVEAQTKRVYDIMNLGHLRKVS